MLFRIRIYSRSPRASYHRRHLNSQFFNPTEEITRTRSIGPPTFHQLPSPSSKITFIPLFSTPPSHQNGQILQRQTRRLLPPRQRTRLARPLRFQAHPTGRAIRSLPRRPPRCRSLRCTRKLVTSAFEGAYQGRGVWEEEVGREGEMEEGSYISRGRDE